MKMQIGRWGNSLAVRLPKALVQRFALKEGDEIDAEAVEAALGERQRQEFLQQREDAFRRIGERRLPLPPGWKFDREEANAR